LYIFWISYFKPFLLKDGPLDEDPALNIKDLFENKLADGFYTLGEFLYVFDIGFWIMSLSMLSKAGKRDNDWGLFLDTSLAGISISPLLIIFIDDGFVTEEMFDGYLSIFSELPFFSSLDKF
jgi:hypothetical protein